MSDSNDPKYKNRLKERPGRPGQKNIGLSQIFGVENDDRAALVPVQKPAAQKGESWQEAETVSKAKTRSNRKGAAGGTGETALASSGTRAHGGTRPNRKSNDQRGPLIPILIVMIVVAGLFLLFGMPNKGGVGTGAQTGSATSASVHPDTIQPATDRAGMHRALTGSKLNRERIGVEYDNAMTAPTDVKFDRKHNPNEMLSGLPLNGETHHRDSTRDRSVPLDPDYADAGIQYRLLEEKAHREWEEKEKKRIVEKFIADAARQGYKVVVDKDGVAHVMGRIAPVDRQPNSDTKAGPSMPGGAR